MIDPGLQDKVVLITGANNPSGIGAGCARAFAGHGARLFLHGYRLALDGEDKNEPSSASGTHEPSGPGEAFYYQQGNRPLSETIESIRTSGILVEGLEGDLTDPSFIPELYDQIESALGPVEILINNAAHWEADTFIPPDQTLANLAVELWTDRPAQITAGSIDRHFAVNTRAVALLSAEFARRHIARRATWGRIVNISTAGSYLFPSEVSYGASKFALEGYTRSAAAELGQFGITVNAIAPGPVQTGWITPELEDQILPSIPMGRVGQPADIANAVVFLASDQAAWVTGQKIFIGGGHGM